MSTWLWLLAGLLVGVLNVASIARTVGRLQPGGDVRALSSMVSGFILRMVLIILVLVFALRQSAVAGLLAFAGLWLGRWPVLLWVNGSANHRKARA